MIMTRIMIVERWWKSGPKECKREAEWHEPQRLQTSNVSGTQGHRYAVSKARRSTWRIQWVVYNTSALCNTRLWDSTVPGCHWERAKANEDKPISLLRASYLACLVIIDIKSNLVNDKVSKQNWLFFVRALKWPLIQLNSGLILKSSVFRWLAWTQSKGTLYPPPIVVIVVETQIENKTKYKEDMDCCGA